MYRVHTNAHVLTCVRPACTHRAFTHQHTRAPCMHSHTQRPTHTCRACAHPDMPTHTQSRAHVHCTPRAMHTDPLHHSLCASTHTCAQGCAHQHVNTELCTPAHTHTVPHTSEDTCTETHACTELHTQHMGAQRACAHPAHSAMHTSRHMHTELCKPAHVHTGSLHSRKRMGTQPCTHRHRTVHSSTCAHQHTYAHNAVHASTPTRAIPRAYVRREPRAPAHLCA